VNRLYLPFVVGLLPFVIGACVYDRTGRSGSSVLVRDMQANQVAVERVGTEVAAERARIDAMEDRASLARRNLAKSTATAESLVDSLQALAGELQNIRHALDKGQAFDNDLDMRLADIAFRLMAVEEKLGIEPEPFQPVEEPEPAEEAPDGAATESDGGEPDAPEEGGDDAVAGAVAIPVQDSIPGEEAAEEDDEVTPDLNLLARALKAMQEGNYAQAGRALTDYLDQYSDSARASDARVLLGDCLFELGRYNEAISEYERFIQIAPDHERIPSAMLSQGLAFIELGSESDMQAARVFLDDLIELYPGSPEADKAKRKLEILK